MNVYPLGWIPPDDRTQEQQGAHFRAEGTMIRHHGLQAPDVPKGTKIILTQAWNHPNVVTDVGRRLIRELQNTGSCVKVGGTNALRVTIAAQRIASENPTKAFEPFCWHNYAMSRHYIGDDAQGEGSLGSTFAKSLKQDGVIAWPQTPSDNLPDYTQTGDHINITASQEMAWSSFRNPEVQKVLQLSKDHLLGNAAVLQSADDILAMHANGYGVSFACSRFVGKGAIRGEGSNAYVRGKWDSNGGHQQWTFGFWNHPNDGMLIAVGNNWPDDVYPKDPAGLPLCCVWVPVDDVNAAFRYQAEVYGLSHLNWFPAVPKVLTWGDIWPRQ